jgi:hypothetical protein
VKFDLEPAFFEQLMAVLQEAPKPYAMLGLNTAAAGMVERVNPMVQRLVAQANDKRIQSLEYPPEEIIHAPTLQAEDHPVVRKGRPKGAKNKPKDLNGAGIGSSSGSMESDHTQVI